ncbi:MAG TPA: LL-diaminopimelate aminotransferase [Candidatus Omnitrophota bacterium]|nr:LL-diaminopimelate aminotransferase [Candidatus Omnitrophota bacterium]
MKVDYADRLKKLPPYLFEEIDKAKQKAVSEGKPVIDLGVGDPDRPTPDFIIKELQKAVLDPETHKYALNKGLRVLREEMANWYKERFGVKLDPDTEVLPLLGSKEGIAHVPLAFINPGDTVLIPDPGYPPYNSGSVFAGAEVCRMGLLEKNGFLPELDAIDKKVAERCKLMHINYPNNPTGAVCDKKFYEKVVAFASKNNIIVCSDAAYTEMSYDGLELPSFLEVKGAREVGIEFHSLSKSFNMTGWRVGMAVGNKDILAGLAKVKGNIDSGIFTAIQWASIAALKKWKDVKAESNKVYTERRDVLVNGLNKAGWKVKAPKATFYIWAPVFGKYNSTELTKAMLEKANIVVTPGNGFGEYGEGYIRMTLTVNTDKLEEVVARVKKAFFS